LNRKLISDSIVTFKKLHIFGKNNKINPEDPTYEYLNILKFDMIDNFKLYKENLDLVNFKKTYDEVNIVIKCLI